MPFYTAVLSRQPSKRQRSRHKNSCSGGIQSTCARARTMARSVVFDSPSVSSSVSAAASSRVADARNLFSFFDVVCLFCFGSSTSSRCTLSCFSLSLSYESETSAQASVCGRHALLVVRRMPLPPVQPFTLSSYVPLPPHRRVVCMHCVLVCLLRLARTHNDVV